MARKNKFKTRDSAPTTGLPKQSPSRRLSTTARLPSGRNNPAQASVQPSTRKAAPSFIPLAPTPVPASTPLAPPDVLALSSKYNLCPLRVASGTKLQPKVTQVLKLLESGAASTQEATTTKGGRRGPVVALSAKAPVASKLISVVEISKRELSKSGKAWYQYSVVQGRIEEHMPKKSVDESADTERARGDQGDEEDFETMRSFEDRQKVRAVPVMTVCLAPEPVPELKATYGEQMSKVKLERH